MTSTYSHGLLQIRWERKCQVDKVANEKSMRENTHVEYLQSSSISRVTRNRASSSIQKQDYLYCLQYISGI